ncbi:MAG: hypothetical protein AAGG50_08690 [Bacteroidota bacterium]
MTSTLRDLETPAEVTSCAATDPLLSRNDIERLTAGGITRRWLELAAHKGFGPPMIKLSRRCVRYRRSEFLAWLEKHRVADG